MLRRALLRLAACAAALPAVPTAAPAAAPAQPPASDLSDLIARLKVMDAELDQLLERVTR